MVPSTDRTRGPGLRLIGLTGGIAAGKSTVAAMLRELGCAVIDADELAREVTAPGCEALERIVEAFGPEVVDQDGRLDRARLGQRIFEDPAARGILESITHPAIAAAAARRAAELGARGHHVVFYEAALLVETGRDRELEALVVVTAPDELRVARLIRRSGVTRQEGLQRLAAQLPQADKVRRADYLIDNSGALKQTRAQVEALLARLGLC